MAKNYYKGGVNRYQVKGPDFKDFREFLKSRPGQVSERLAKRMENFGFQGVEIIHETILKSTTKTGEDAVARGLRSSAGRIRSEAERREDKRGPGGKSMYDAVSYRVNHNNNNVTLAVGWLSGKPGYAFFQEHGTSNGVQGMDSLGEVKLWFDAHLARNLK